MKFGFQKFLILLIGRDMCIDGSCGMLEKLLLVSHSQVKCYVVSIRFDSKSEEIDLKFNIELSQILKSQSELSTHYEDLNSLCGIHKLRMIWKEFSDIIVWENNFTVSEFPFSLVNDKNRNEIDELDNGLLVRIYLSILDFNKFVTDVFLDVQHDFILQHVLDHLVIFGRQKPQNIFSGNVEERIIWNGDLELCVFCNFGNEPCWMDKLSSVFKFRVHDKRHEVKLQDHLFESHVHKFFLNFLFVLAFSGFLVFLFSHGFSILSFFILFIINLFLDVVFERIE